MIKLAFIHCSAETASDKWYWLLFNGPSGKTCNRMKKTVYLYTSSYKRTPLIYRTVTKVSTETHKITYRNYNASLHSMQTPINSFSSPHTLKWRKAMEVFLLKLAYVAYGEATVVTWLSIVIKIDNFRYCILLYLSWCAYSGLAKMLQCMRLLAMQES